MKTINTYLPLFNGYYGSQWEFDNESQIESELYHINDYLGKNVTYDDLEINYSSYYNELSKDICTAIIGHLTDNNLVSKGTFENLQSPKYYNYSNDSINVALELSKDNIKIIFNYLNDNKDSFKDYIKEKYTSCSGFCSFYSNDANEWLFEFNKTIEHRHKLGSILDFILLEMEITEDTIFYDLEGNMPQIEITNFNELTQ